MAKEGRKDIAPHAAPAAARWDEAALQKLAGGVLRQLGIRGATLDIFLLRHEDIKSLKARFIRKQTEPNVLSFPEPAAFPHPEAKRKRYLGEVYLNKDILRRSPERAAPLLLHGILHLLGHDHEANEAQALKMEALEASILAKMKSKKPR